MNFDISEEQQLLQDTVGQYIENECPLPRLRAIFDRAFLGIPSLHRERAAQLAGW